MEHTYDIPDLEFVFSDKIPKPNENKDGEN